MTVAACDFPPMSTLDRRWVETAYFRDSYRAPVSRAQASVVEIFLAIFTHHPAWMKAVLIARNHFASFCGLDAPAAEEVMNPRVKDHYVAGDKIGVWPQMGRAMGHCKGDQIRQAMKYGVRLVGFSND